MLLNYTFIPFLLALKVNVPVGTKNFNAEYLFDFNLTAVVYKEFPGTTQTTAALICQPFLLRGLRCFLQNVITSKIAENKTWNITEVVSREHIKYEKWFMINFNEHGVKDILVHTKSEGTINKIILYIANHFNISGGMVTKLLNMPSGLTAKEETPLFTCRRTSYNISKMYYIDHETNEKQDFKFQIVPFAMAKHFAQQRNTSTHIRIMKNRKKCKLDSVQVGAFSNKTEVGNYNYTMEIVDDKLKMSTAARIRLPADLCNSTACLVMTETILLNLTNIRSPQTIAQDKFYNWTALII